MAGNQITRWAAQGQGLNLTFRYNEGTGLQVAEIISGAQKLSLTESKVELLYGATGVLIETDKVEIGDINSIETGARMAGIQTAAVDTLEKDMIQVGGDIDDPVIVGDASIPTNIIGSEINIDGEPWLGVVWGGITGTLSDQTDLHTELSRIDNDIATNAGDIVIVADDLNTHETAGDPHPQYLTLSELPSTISSWFTNDASSIDGLFLNILPEQSVGPESQLSKVTAGENSPQELGQWLRAANFTEDFRWFETITTYELEIELDNSNTNIVAYIELSRRPIADPGNLVPIATSESAILREGRHLYTISANITDVEMLIDDNVVTRLFVDRESAGTDSTVTLIMEGDSTTHGVTQIPIPTYPGPHAADHEVGGSDLITHDNLTGAGTNTHAQIDTHIADVASNPHAVTLAQVGGAPEIHASQHEVGGSDLISHNDLTNAQGFKSHATIDSELLVWGNIYNSSSSYLRNDIVRDDEWTMVANADTSDRPAPQPNGAPVWGIDPASLFTTSQYIGIVKTVHEYTIITGGWLERSQVRVPGWNTNTVVNISFAINDEAKVMSNPVLADDEWVTLSTSPGIVKPGDVIIVWLEVYNSDPASQISSIWNSNIGTGEPNNQEFNLSDARGNGTLEIDHTDLDGTNHTTELRGVALGSIINLTESGDLGRITRIRTTSVDSTNTLAYSTYTYDFLDIGKKGELRDNKTTIVSIDIPVVINTDYTILAGGYTTDPVWASMNTSIWFDGVDQNLLDNAYGINLLYQGANVSDDWELLAYSGSSGAGAGTLVVGDLSPSLGGNLDLGANWLATTATVSSGQKLLWKVFTSEVGSVRNTEIYGESSTGETSLTMRAFTDASANNATFRIQSETIDSGGLVIAPTQIKTTADEITLQSPGLSLTLAGGVFKAGAVTYQDDVPPGNDYIQIWDAGGNTTWEAAITGTLGGIDLVRASRTSDWTVNSTSYTFLPFDRLDKETNAAVIIQSATDDTKFIVKKNGYFEGYVSFNNRGHVDTAFFRNGVLEDESEREIRIPNTESVSSHIEFADQLFVDDEIQFAFKSDNSDGFIFDFAKIMIKRLGD